jgi:hypothetical protein
MKLVGGADLTEFAISQAYHSYLSDLDRRELLLLENQLSLYRNCPNLFAASKNTTDGWDKCLAIVNNKPMQCYRVGKYLIMFSDDQVVKLSRFKKLLMKMFGK